MDLCFAYFLVGLDFRTFVYWTLLYEVQIGCYTEETPFMSDSAFRIPAALELDGFISETVDQYGNRFNKHNPYVLIVYMKP